MRERERVRQGVEEGGRRVRQNVRVRRKGGRREGGKKQGELGRSLREGSQEPTNPQTHSLSAHAPILHTFIFVTFLRSLITTTVGICLEIFKFYS